jgi:hypothetical protein
MHTLLFLSAYFKIRGRTRPRIGFSLDSASRSAVLSFSPFAFRSAFSIAARSLATPTAAPRWAPPPRETIRRWILVKRLNLSSVEYRRGPLMAPTLNDGAREMGKCQQREGEVPGSTACVSNSFPNRQAMVQVQPRACAWWSAQTLWFLSFVHGSSGASQGRL